jgi:hypothetical protein
MKRLIVFDLDGTLAPSKSSIDTEMVNLLNSLLAIVKVAVISGGAWPQFEQQVLARLRPDACLKNLSLLPTCGTKFYRMMSVGSCFIRRISPRRREVRSSLPCSGQSWQRTVRSRKSGAR